MHDMNSFLRGHIILIKDPIWKGCTPIAVLFQKLILKNISTASFSILYRSYMLVL